MRFVLTLNCFCWCLYTKKFRVVHSQLANECLMVSYGFLPSILQVWVAEGWQVWPSYLNVLFQFRLHVGSGHASVLNIMIQIAISHGPN